MYSTAFFCKSFADSNPTLRYSNTFTDEQVKKLHDAMMYVCDTAVGTLAESDKFPEDWLMKYRWSKGKKENPKLPNGAKITFLKVGGRTSAIVPSVQKKTAAVAGDVSEGADDQSEEEIKPKKATKRKSKPKHEDEDEEVKEEEDEAVPAAKKQKMAANGAARKGNKIEQLVKSEEEIKPKKATKRKSQPKHEDEDEEVKKEEDEVVPVAKKQKKAAKGTARKGKKAEELVESEDVSGRRRSGRLSKG
jgi:formamidopyrimidine-DNA glycosylase